MKDAIKGVEIGVLKEANNKLSRTLDMQSIKGKTLRDFSRI